MTTPTKYEPLSPVEEIEQEASVAELAVGGTLRGIEIAGAVLLGLLICPPLAILAAVVVVPFAALVLVGGLIFAVFSAPVLVVHELRGHHGHAAVYRHRLGHAGRAVFDLLPHRVVAGARRGVHAR
jgi:hypothetical protein